MAKILRLCIDFVALVFNILRVNLFVSLNSRNYSTSKIQNYLINTDNINYLITPSPGIPNAIHVVWVGDPCKKPAELINSWRVLNPKCIVRVWDNDDYFSRKWLNAELLNYFWKQKRYESMADIMRYEILFFEGGFAVDADSLCLKTLPSFMFELNGFTCYENEKVAPGLLSNGYLAAQSNSPLLSNILSSILNDKRVKSLPGWITLGPGRLTSAYRSTRPAGFTIFPSHYFIPEHYSGRKYMGSDDNVYARQYWASTTRRNQSFAKI